MKQVSQQVKQIVSRRPQQSIGIVIFITCLLVYLANNQLISSNDNIPNSLLAFQWLKHHSLNFDAFRDSFYFRGNNSPYFFVEAPNGHLTSTYPIGTAIVTFPLYCLFFIYLKIASLINSGVSGIELEISSQEFVPYAEACEKFAATIITSVSVVFFYLAARLRFSRAIALLGTLTFAVATPTWALISQGLRQHTASNFVLMALILCLLKVNRIQGTPKRLLLLVAGILCGLIITVRPTSLLFAVTIFLYGVVTYRKQALYLLLGGTLALLTVAWNVYYFGSWSIVGGYSRQFDVGASSYDLSSGYASEAFAGLLVSPSEGYLIFAPVAIFAGLGAYQVFKQRSDPDERLIGALTLACLILFIHYCFYVPWSGGSGSYGPRFLSDTLPVVGLLICYFLSHFIERRYYQTSRFWTGLLVVFLACYGAGFSIQAVGAFSDTSWGTVPLPLNYEKTRVWNLTDSRIIRHVRSIVSEVNPPIGDEDEYLKDFRGTITTVTKIDKQSRDELPPETPIVGKAGSRVVLIADLENIGTAPWYGYQYALDRGEAQVRVGFVKPDQTWTELKSDSRLYISSTVQPGEHTKAIGLVQLPNQPGNYQLTFNLVAHRLIRFPGDAFQPDYGVLIEVK
ncbi:MAG: hypothetical protein ACFE0I_15515 [Elainellaceae cyanobacterium]